jgi:23S rRNA (adenine2503-C2)-methyltransferase
MLSIHEIQAVEQFCRGRRLDPQRLRQLRNAFYKQHLGSGLALEKLPAGERAEFERGVRFNFLALENQADSRIDGASKLILRTDRGWLIEAVVLRLTTGRNALCLSSQVGCAAKCAFCATGKMAVTRNLSASEIVDQAIHANRILSAEGRRLRNLVFMGMGEPFHNEENLHEAIDVLTAPQCFEFAPERILISTVGIPEAMVRCARRTPRVRLALSLHSARQAVREEIVPLARRYGLDELQNALREVARLQNHRVMIEYLMLKGLTDTADDVRALTGYLAGIPVHINLIPFNPIAGAGDLAGSDAQTRTAFAVALKTAGFPVTIRYSLGADIGAACGQLVERANRRTAELNPAFSS